MEGFQEGSYVVRFAFYKTVAGRGGTEEPEAEKTVWMLFWVSRKEPAGVELCLVSRERYRF